MGTQKHAEESRTGSTAHLADPDLICTTPPGRGGGPHGGGSLQYCGTTAAAWGWARQDRALQGLVAQVPFAWVAWDHLPVNLTVIRVAAKASEETPKVNAVPL